MGSDLNSCLRQLKICLDTQQVPQARMNIARITQLIVDRTIETQAETDFNLECVFSTANGLVSFLQHTLTKAKHFAKANEDILELFRKTIEKHSPLLGKRMAVIVPIALRYIQSSTVTARERELATLVLQDSIAYGCLNRETYDQLGNLSQELLQIFEQRKLPSRFQQNLYELQGQLANQFPDCVTEAERLRDVFLNAAENQLLEQNYPSLVSLAGAIRGLDLFLVHFAPGESEHELRKRLYLLVKKLSIWDEGRSERSVFRNALQLMANHAILFTVHLFEDHIHWQAMLVGKWLKSSNRDDRRIAVIALYAFHGEVARVLSTPSLVAGGDREYHSVEDVLNLYLAYYRKLLNSSSADRWEVRTAIRGFGIMAEPCQLLAGSSTSLNELLTIVLERIEGICGRSTMSTVDMLECLPDFMQALSEILAHVKELSTVQLVSIQTMSVALMRDFHHLPSIHHDLIIRSLVCTLENVGKLGGSVRDQLLDNILLQGVIWSCTHALPFASSFPLVDDASRKVDWKRELVTYKHYIPLWKGLFIHAEKANSETSQNEADSLTRAVYNALMRTLFVIVDKLDLSTRKRTFQDEIGEERELFFCDPNIELLPTKPKDYHIFLNMVELYRDVLHGPHTPLAVREFFSDWVRPYFDRFVKESLRCPLVSGFIKLIEMGLGTAEQIGYFRRATIPADNSDAHSTLMLLMFYLEQTVQRGLDAVGELQLACLRFVLNAPVHLVVDFIRDDDQKQASIVELFRTAFCLGRGLLSVARTALYCLRRIVRFRHPPVSAKLREQLLRQVLPMLEPFLRTRDSAQQPAQSLRLAKFKRHRTVNVAAAKIEQIKQQHRIERATDTSELVAFQMRILHFFADLQPNECCWLVADDQWLTTSPVQEHPEGSSLTRWDADSGLSVELRLLCENGTRPCIKLDGIIGRVCQLAVECSDRATKLAACELLHTLILYLLGIHYQDKFSALWAQLCHNLLQLSSDTDLAVCQMFEPLLFQIIHLLTQPAKLSQQGTSALLDCLLDATSNAQHSAIRDLAVRGLREFLQWTNRQSGSSEMVDERRKIKSRVLEQLKTQAMESNSSRRYGSALALNNLFRLLLQEDFHIVRYGFEVMHSFAIGFIVTEEQIGLLSDADSNTGAAIEQFQVVLEHLCKVFELRKELFNPRSEELLRTGHRQIVPAAIGGGQLEYLVRWIFRQCALRQRSYRRKCMQLFPRLARVVRNVESGEDFLAKHFSSEQIEAICLQADNIQGISQVPTLNVFRHGQTVELVTNIYVWLEYFLASLDVCCWLLREKLIPSELSRSLLSRIVPTVQYFLTSVVHMSIYELMTDIKPEVQFESNADKIVRFDALKSAIIVQIVDLLLLILPLTGTSLEDVVCALWQDEATINFLLALLFKPHQFDLEFSGRAQRGIEDDRHFWKKMDKLVGQLTDQHANSTEECFAKALSEQIILVMQDLGGRMKTLLVQRTIGTVDQKSAKGLLFVARNQSLRASGSSLLAQGERKKMWEAADKLLKDCYEAIGQEHRRLVLSPSAVHFGTLVLQGIFSLFDAAEPIEMDRLIHTSLTYCLNDEILIPNIRHGEHFMVCFGSAVFELFFAKPSECFHTLMKALTEENFSFIVQVLCRMMEHTYRMHSSDTDRLRLLVQTLLHGWDELFKCSRLMPNRFGACDLQMIEWMSHIAMICPFALYEISLQTAVSYKQWLVNLIGDTQTPISLKAKAIVLLPTVLGPDSPPATDLHCQAFENALEKLQSSHFPLRSKEFAPNSPEGIGFLNCLERLLDALVVSRSPLLLKAIVHMTAPDGEGHVAETQIRSAIERFFKEQPLEMQNDRLDELWQLFTNHSYAPVVRATILRRYLCTGLWHCRYDSIAEFYKRNIRSISDYTTAEISGRSGWELEHALVDRAAAFRLIEHYAALLPKATLLTENCPVGQALYASTPVRGQRLIGEFSKRAHNVRKVPFHSEYQPAVELFRKYQCAAYRALAALLSNTNEDPRMFSVLLFRENREKAEYLWRLLIDCTNEDLYLEAGQELDQTPRMVEKRVAIRREDGSPRSRVTSDPSQSVVTESSLSQQVSRFDLSHSVILSAREVAQKDAAELSKRQQGALSSVPLERTKINEHEIMATVCGCLQRMNAAKITLDGTVHFVAASLTDPNQPKNVRLFLAKVLDNCRGELKPHASLLVGPLMQLIVDKHIFKGLNTLVTDLIALLLEWSTDGLPLRSLREGAVEENASLACLLLRFIMRHACEQQGTAGGRAQVFRLNVELIKQLITQWRDVLIVPEELLFEKITLSRLVQMDERSQFELAAGLQLSIIVLINGDGRLVPWMDSTRREYLAAVLRCLDAPNSSIYKPGAQLLGLCLAQLYPDGPPEQRQESREDNFFADCIAKLSQIQHGQGRKCVELLYEAAKGFPSIADPFLSLLSFRIPGATGPEKRMCLELMLGGRIENFNDELFRELASMDLPGLLRDADLQLPTLHLINRSLALVSEMEHLQQLIEPVGQIAVEPSTRSECRAIAYEILIYIHENRVEQLSDDSRQTVWRYLVRGLCNAEESDATGTSVRVRVLEYLTESGRLPGDIKERFLYLLSDLYDPTVEAEFLGCAVAVLLDPAIRCRESKDRLFLHEYVSVDVKFQEYTIETGARQRHAMTVLTPLFAETSTQRQMQTFITGMGSQMERMIKATQFSQNTSRDGDSTGFEPTQDPSTLTRARETFAMPTQHGILFETNSLQLDRRSQRALHVTSAMASQSQQEHTFERLRKRILKDSATTRQQQTAWAVSRHYTTLRQQMEHRRETATKVTLYRRYRLADYPDLQINLLAFLLPLQALCRRDTACARQTFVAIFTGLVECLSSVGPGGDEWNRFVVSLDQSIQRIMSSTKSCDPHLFAGLVELTLGKTSGKMTLCPRTVVSVAGASNMLTMGVLYLEGKLADGDEFDEEPVCTGGRRSSEAEHWLQLSILYHTLREHNVVVGIFGDKQDSDPRLREAIELEALGRYDRAYRAYDELISTISPARCEERNFCQKSAYDCLLRLGQWEVLLDKIGGQVTHHDQLWSDEWNREHLLPNYMHGNVRLNLAGDVRGREFCRILEEWMHIPDRSEHIKQQFGEELAALQIACAETVRARMYAEQSHRQFLEEWHCAGVLSEVVRIECLLGVRKVIELLAYTEVLERNPQEMERVTGELVATWKHAHPSVTDSLTVWDTIVAYRRFLLEQLKFKHPSGDLSQLSTLLFELELHLLEVASEQNNVKFVGNLIARLRSDEATTGAREPLMEQVLRRRIARLRYDRMRQVESSCSLTAGLLGGFRRLARLITQTPHGTEDSGMARAKQSAWTELFQYAQTVREMTGGDVRPEDRSMVLEIIAIAGQQNVQNLSEQEEGEGLNGRLRQFSLHCLQRSIDAVQQSDVVLTELNNTGSMSELSAAYLCLARYCYDELDLQQNDTEVLTLERMLVTSLLPAMKYGSREARHLFPVLLQLRNLQNGVLRDEFDQHSQQVPTWNFLPWIPQLLSYMKITPETIADYGHYLDDLLMRLAREYPMALYFPARLVLRAPEQTSGAVRWFVDRFLAALSFPRVDRFVAELCRVVMPETRLLGMIAELRNRLSTFTDPSSYQAYIDQAGAEGFPADAHELPNWGNAYRTSLPLVDKWRQLRHLHPITDRTEIIEQLMAFEVVLNKLRSRTKTRQVQLEDYSPWLADYHAGGQEQWEGPSIELPGQYGLDAGPPNPGRHVTIVKVVPDLVVYQTLRLPVQISFRGSDGRLYRFLAKYGDDLRQDQRIQQLQREITHRLRWDRRCREQRLELRTYEVVPIRPEFGMLSWLDGTIPLDDIAAQAGSRYNPAYRGQMNVREEFDQFLREIAKQRGLSSNELADGLVLNVAELYGTAAAFCRPERLRSKFVELSQAIRGNSLKRALFDMAATPELFYQMRMNFARSLAAMNVTCWVLGIGDRHLGNIVLERASGKLVGVDFGIAFGAGARDLPVPELVPFRLTPQLVGVMDPMRLPGELQTCHLYTLQCLRDSRKLLRACLEVFIREPTVDWLRAAREWKCQNTDDTGEQRKREWNPQVRIETIMRKLNGANPKQLLVDDLQCGLVGHQREFLLGYLSIVEAAAAVSTEKAQCSEQMENLSTELQNEMLLEMATDGTLLGLMYAGWYPWF
ncbi:DNA-dependent protein kinase catalytic subunit-like [Anopheles nili]|uniref:DNA-dependent protein kinase catalytic subunit-like n=1 Tax=Anopheles nili TaxID=185578 RepID=UPI00237BC8DD|nr:DNA-dependent protein kinase catalytic subunit-like [Anopheles nili]